MNNYLKYSIGNDISMDKFDSCLSVIDKEQRVIIKASRSFKNNKNGFNSFQDWVQRHLKYQLPVSFTMEATGVYYEALAIFLHEQGYYVSVVLPNKAKSYLKSLGIKSKNDKIDAKGLSQMGAEQRLEQWKPYSKTIYELRSLTRQSEKLNKQKSIFNNQLHAEEHSGYINKTVVEQLNKMIALISTNILEVKQAIKKLVSEDKPMKERIEKICKVKGLDLLSIATVIAETNGFVLFKNQSQLVSYAGYDVIENSSGKHVGKTKISKRGNSHIRRILHMPSLITVRCNEPHFKALYERIFDKTKIKMKGYVAVQKKLLLLIYTLWKKNEVYDPNYNKTSGNDEPKLLFSLGFEESEKKVPTFAGTQDELPCNESPEVLFSLM